jgi:hypothetical protein
LFGFFHGAFLGCDLEINGGFVSAAFANVKAEARRTVEMAGWAA